MLCMKNGEFGGFRAHLYFVLPDILPSPQQRVLCHPSPLPITGTQLLGSINCRVFCLKDLPVSQADSLV